VTSREAQDSGKAKYRKKRKVHPKKRSSSKAAKAKTTKTDKRTPHPVSTNKPIIGQNSAPNMYLLKQRKPSWKKPAFMKPFVLVLHLATKSTS